MRSGKMYLAMKTVVIQSHHDNKAVAVFRQSTATDLKYIAKRMGLTIPDPVVVKPKAKKRVNVLYSFLEEGGF